MRKEKPKRKSTRLHHFDYSTTGAYFITICTRNRMKILSEITIPSFTQTNTINGPKSVGEVLAPPADRLTERDFNDVNSSQNTPCAVGEVLAPPADRLTERDFNVVNSSQNTPCAVGEVLAPPADRLTERDFNVVNLSQNTPCAVGEGLAPPAPILSDIGKIVEEQMTDLEERYKNILIDEYVIMPDHVHLILFIKNAGGASPSPTAYDVICTFKSLTSRICKQRFGIENIFQRSFYDHVIRNQKDYEIRKKYIRENPIKWYYYQVYEDQ